MPFPKLVPLPSEFEGEILLKVGDNITTDHILPGGNDVLPLRSNIPAISEHFYERVDKTLYKRCKEKGGGVIIGAENYGQGSSREHAGLVPRYLGIQVKIAKGFARIHRSNLINFGVVPLLFTNSSDYDRLKQGDRLSFPNLRKLIEEGKEEIIAKHNDREIKLKLKVSERERRCILEGGYLNLVKKGM